MTQKASKVEYPIHEMEDEAKLIIPPHIIAQIQYLHSHCGGDEWSGMLLYDVIKGDVSDPANLEIEVKHIFLMDIGNAAYTEYETDEDIVDIYDNIPDAMGWKTGHIHTHHSGSTYFSGTDMDELHTNVDKHNYYLSLVVNFKGTYSAKIVFLSDMHITSKMNFVTDAGKTEHFKKSKIEKHMVVIDMKIFYGELGGFFANRLTEVKKKIAAKKKATPALGYSYGQYPRYDKNGGGHNNHFNGKLDVNKLTSWEIESLTKNVLLLADKGTTGNVYSILHKIADQNEEELDIYYDYLYNNAEMFIRDFFDIHLDVNEFKIAVKEVIFCINKYEGIPKLRELISNLTEGLNMLVLDADDIADQNDEINEAEKEMQDEIKKMEKDIEV